MFHQKLNPNKALLIVLFIATSLSVFAQNEPTTAYIPWSRGNSIGLYTSVHQNRNSSYHRFQVIENDTEYAFLSATDSRIVIYSATDFSKPKQIIQLGDLGTQPYHFFYANRAFYLMGANRDNIKKIDRATVKVLKEWTFEQAMINIQSIYVIGDTPYIVSDNQETYKVSADKLTLQSEKGLIFDKTTVTIDVQAQQSMSFTLKNAQGQSNKKYKLKELGLPENVASVTPINIVNGNLYVHVAMANDTEVATKDFMLVFDKKANFIIKHDIPFIYYTQCDNRFSPTKNGIMYALSAPEGTYLKELGTKATTFPTTSVKRFNYKEYITNFNNKYDASNLYDTTQTFGTYMQKIQALQDSFPELKNEPNVAEIYTTPNIDMLFMSMYKPLINTATDYLLNPPSKSPFLIDFYRQMISFNVAKGNIDIAMQLHERLHKDYKIKEDDEQDAGFEEYITIVKAANTDLQRLEKQKNSLAPDAFLFQKATILDTLFPKIYYLVAGADYGGHVVGEDEGVSWKVPGYLYQQILKQYPKSDLADDAEFAFKGNCEIPNEGAPSDVDSTCVRYWEAWLPQYPTASVRPKVYQHLARIYYTMVDMELIELDADKNRRAKKGTLDALQKSKYYSDIFKKEYPDLWKKDVYFQEVMEQVAKRIVEIKE